MTTSPRILLVDDEPPIVRVLRPSLAAAGYAVEVAETAGQAVAAVSAAAPDLIILDLGLPDADGKQVIESVREWCAAPIIVLSARHEADERIAALDLGADDYVAKPFHMGELLARIRTALRRRERAASGKSVYEGCGLSIDFARRLVRLEGEEIKLTRREYDLLRTLALHAGQVVTHRQLLTSVWGADASDVQLVRVFIGQLRQKIELNSSTPTLILTEPGIGYRLRVDE